MTESTQLTPRQRQEIAVSRMVEFLPSHVDHDRFSTFALAVMRDKALDKCTEESKMLALADCAKLGLLPDKNLGHVWLVPYGNAVTLIPGYQGYIELARRSGAVKTVHTDIVRANDDFRVWTDEKGRHLHHQPNPFGDRGDRVGVYCVATLANGTAQIETMTWKEVMLIKARSAAASKGPWGTDEDMMARKTVVRRARKYWPQSPELAHFGQLDDELLNGQVDSTPTLAPAKSLDDLAKRMMDEPEPEPEQPQQPEPGSAPRQTSAAPQQQRAPQNPSMDLPSAEEVAPATQQPNMFAEPPAKQEPEPEPEYQMSDAAIGYLVKIEGVQTVDTLQKWQAYIEKAENISFQDKINLQEAITRREQELQGAPN